MKNLIILMILLIVSCKKEKIQVEKPTSINTEICTTDSTHYFEGKYLSNKDTIYIVYKGTDCKDHNIQYYSVYGLLQAFLSQKDSIENKPYELISNEINKAFERGIIQIVWNVQSNTYSLTRAFNYNSCTLRMKKIPA